MFPRRGPVSTIAAAALALSVICLAGCGDESLKTHPVQGKVALTDGEVQGLADHFVELQSATDPYLRADARIEPDGRFAMRMQHKGKILQGAPEGAYTARILLGDPDDAPRTKRQSPPVHPRFLNFKSSGLVVNVPADGPVQLTVSRR